MPWHFNFLNSFPIGPFHSPILQSAWPIWTRLVFWRYFWYRAGMPKSLLIRVILSSSGPGPVRSWPGPGQNTCTFANTKFGLPPPTHQTSNLYCMTSNHVPLISAFKMAFMMTFRMTLKNWDFQGGLRRGLGGAIQGIFQSVFYGDLELEEDLKGSGSGHVQVRSGQGQVLSSFNSLELDSEVERLV